MTVNKPKFRESEVYQKFNLKKLFGVDFSKDSDLRDNIAQEIIDVMLERTAKGKDIDGAKFTKYSDAYKKSDEFGDFKSSSKVNMDLRGNMLEDIDIIAETTNTIKIGFSDELETKKAYRHNTGDKGMTERQFFGVTDKEIKKIKRDFASELAELKETPPKEKKQTVADLLLEAEAFAEFF
jgi:hypothetical protein